MDTGTRRVHAIAALAVLAGALAAADRAQAAVTCSYEPLTRTVTAQLGHQSDASDEQVRLVRIGDAIGWVATTRPARDRPAPCGAATVTNTDTIRVEGDPLAQGNDVEIDERPGAFAPGATPEPGGLSEIEFQLDLTGTSDVLIDGTHGPDTIALGVGAIALNGDDDADVTISGQVHEVVVWAGAGDDAVSGRGGHGATGPAPALDADGGAGNDLLEAAPQGSILIGRSGNDRLRGGPGPDSLHGDIGNDSLFGGGGEDFISGGAGDDHLGARDGEADSVFGGGGFDVACVDRALDTVGSVERLGRCT